MKLLVKTINGSLVIAALFGCVVLLLFGWSATGLKALAIPTRSMQPAIPQYSLVFVRRVPIDQLKVGDVITYVNPLIPTETLSHRIIKIYTIGNGQYGFVTKGDANQVADVPITQSSIKGEVFWHVPYLGGWLLKAKKPWVVLPVVYLASMLLMAEEVIRLRDYYRAKQKYYFKQPRPGSTPVESMVASTVVILILSLMVFSLVTAKPALALMQSQSVSLSSSTIDSRVP